VHSIKPAYKLQSVIDCVCTVCYYYFIEK